MLGKIAHYTLLLAVPWHFHGAAAALTAAAMYSVTESVVLASTFAVSHNVPEAKPLEPNGVPRATLVDTDLAERDWGVQQIVTSANWGGVVGNFFTGGLNLQVEHHLFPAISFMHYPGELLRALAPCCLECGCSGGCSGGCGVSGCLFLCLANCYCCWLD